MAARLVRMLSLYGSEEKKEKEPTLNKTPREIVVNRCEFVDRPENDSHPHLFIDIGRSTWEGRGTPLANLNKVETKLRPPFKDNICVGPS